ncbi:unnamed protein product [Miscanthus lutarioriparius]|uniref:Uncharacterized protein n=1 Tax=Miscanthus lutarioriparius TaxID=422564 RepID=A0A811MZN9_9POAL|nr:unnamed protein product [Miscanthus lutarioriparius]
MEVMVPGRSLMMAMAIGSIPATGNARGKKKADGNCQWEEEPSTYKRKKTNADHDSSYNNVMPPSGNAWNAGDGIGRPNAKSNAGSSWGEKDKMEFDEHLEVPKESNTWNTGKSNESPWDNTYALQDSWVNSAKAQELHIFHLEQKNKSKRTREMAQIYPLSA